MTQFALQTNGLTKKYGRRVIVDNVNISIQKGDIYGLIGRNGAGKTTFMRTCLGMATVSSGTISFPALEKEMATHFSVLAWRIPGMREPGGLLSMGLHRVGHD